MRSIAGRKIKVKKWLMIGNWGLTNTPQGCRVSGMKQKQTNHPHHQYQELTQSAKRRIKIIQGQLNGLAKMIENDEYCIDILNQSTAIQASLKSLDALVLERHLVTHVKKQFRTEPNRAIKELLKVFKQANKWLLISD